MKVFVAGATGVLGRRAVRLLVEAGHDVTGVARSPAKAQRTFAKAVVTAQAVATAQAVEGAQPVDGGEVAT